MCKAPYTKATKVCKDCHLELPVSKFHFAGKLKLAYQSYCKTCASIRNVQNTRIKRLMKA